MRLPFKPPKRETPEQIERELDALAARQEARRKTVQREKELAAKEGRAYFEVTDGPPGDRPLMNQEFDADLKE